MNMTNKRKILFDNNHISFMTSHTSLSLKQSQQSGRQRRLKTPPTLNGTLFSHKKRKKTFLDKPDSILVSGQTGTEAVAERQDDGVWHKSKITAFSNAYITKTILWSCTKALINDYVLRNSPLLWKTAPSYETSEVYVAWLDCQTVYVSHTQHNLRTVALDNHIGWSCFSINFLKPKTAQVF